MWSWWVYAWCDYSLMPVRRQLSSSIKPRPPPAPAIAAAVSSTAFGSTTAAFLFCTGYFASLALFQWNPTPVPVSSYWYWSWFQYLTDIVNTLNVHSTALPFEACLLHCVVFTCTLRPNLQCHSIRLTFTIQQVARRCLCKHARIVMQHAGAIYTWHIQPVDRDPMPIVAFGPVHFICILSCGDHMCDVIWYYGVTCSSKLQQNVDAVQPTMAAAAGTDNNKSVDLTFHQMTTSGLQL